jgi:2-dehydro-3-deoxyphosphooctonate aldolase (KDO 8-P synthase)
MSDMVKTKVVDAGGVKIGGGLPLVLIGGPCVIEDEALVLDTARRLKELCGGRGIPFIFKSSYDKANRSSADAFRGPGLKKGLEILARVRAETRLPVLVDVHEVGHVSAAAEVADILQVPAFLCRQTDLIEAVCRSGRVVNIKKGQFLAPWDAKNIIGKCEAFGATGILITERGSSFGYNNLVSDMRSLPLMRGYGWPVVFDATHSVQLPGGLGTSTGGQREFVPCLARAAVAAGCDALFLELHPDPDRALCDGPNQLPLGEAGALLDACAAIHRVVTQPGR